MAVVNEGAENGMKWRGQINRYHSSYFRSKSDIKGVPYKNALVVRPLIYVGDGVDGQQLVVFRQLQQFVVNPVMSIRSYQARSGMRPLSGHINQEEAAQLSGPVMPGRPASK